MIGVSARIVSSALLVQRRRDREAVADAVEAARALEEDGELAVADLAEAVLRELRLEPPRVLFARAERRRRSREVRLAAAALELEQRCDRVRPRPVEEELAERQAGVERLAPARSRSRSCTRAELVEPLRR